MSKAVESAVLNAVVMYQQRQTWKKWGLHTMRKQGAAILLVGESGTGKTTIAEYLSLKIRKRGLKQISFSDFGSHVPGENSRQIQKLFADAKENGEMTVFLDECEAVLVDRDLLGSSAMWMLEVVDELLVQIGKYPGLTVLATNKPEFLDKALRRRLIAVIHVLRPEHPERVRLWQQKIPDTYPLKLSIAQFEKIATLQLTGADIENVIIEYSSECIRTNKKPKFDTLFENAMLAEVELKTQAAEREKALQATAE